MQELKVIQENVANSLDLDNVITYIRNFCEVDPNFVLCREDQLTIKLIKL